MYRNRLQFKMQQLGIIADDEDTIVLHSNIK